MPEYYQIVVRGHLGSRWTTWIEGITVTVRGTGSDAKTMVSGYAVDQAALLGILSGIRDLGLPLVSVSSSRPES